MALPFDVQTFSRTTLGDTLVAYSHGRNPAVADKPQVRFLHRYLDNLGCLSFVVERAYTDRNFLEDYAAYYVRCFEPYLHVCTRLHFFKRCLDHDALCQAIVGDQGKDLQDDYLGFIVVKPLPLTVIGRTCLTAYGPVKGRERSFPTVKPQQVDLYGMKLEVKTLPFQEQDREVAACASSALWTMLHSTSPIFQHAMPSPVEITKAGTAHAGVDGRTFPNGGGLNPLQIADAIRSVGLEPFVIGVSSVPRLAIPAEDYASGAAPPSSPAAPPAAEMELELKLAVLAYLRSGIACALLAQTADEVDGELILRGNHAVAITGYCLGDTRAEEGYHRSGTRFRAERLDRLYVHDDQTGPFTSFVFESGNMLVAEDFSAPQVTRRLARPVNLVVPLYHKIRIPLAQVVKLTVALDEMLESIKKGALPLDDRFEWDIELISLEDLRDDISASGLTPETKLDLLTCRLPRFVWRVRALLANKKVFDLLLDATDLLQGELVRRVVLHDRKLGKQIGRLLQLSREIRVETLRSTIRAFDEAVRGPVASTATSETAADA